jgi:hypothetical protein
MVLNFDEYKLNRQFISKALDGKGISLGSLGNFKIWGKPSFSFDVKIELLVVH